MHKFIRKANRLRSKPIYKTNNSFFVTVCVEGRTCIFVERVTNGQNGDPKSLLQLNTFGKIVEQAWLDLPNVFENIILDEFVVMPNHFHGIITFLDVPKSVFTGKESNLGKIIKRFKLESLRKIVETVTDGQNCESHSNNTKWRSEIASTKNLIQKYNSVWQKSFYDHVIRDYQDLQRIQEYIYTNTTQQKLDILNPVN